MHVRRARAQVVVAVDQEQELFAVTELKQWSFFGLHHQNVVVVPLPRFPGFAQVRPLYHPPCELTRAPWQL